MIVRHELQPGEWIAEAQLSQALGVSRTPLREALKALAAERLVVLHPFRGATVTDLSLEQVEHLFETQAILEAQAARLAASRASAAEIAAFEKKHLRMLGYFTRGDRKPYFELNQELHRDLVAMSHNPVIIETHAVILTQVERARFAALDIGHRWEESVAQHEAILLALKARDIEHLGQLVGIHVIGTGQTVRVALRTLETDLPLAAVCSQSEPSPPAARNNKTRSMAGRGS
ncbi:hypothetical protein AXW83_21230 [Bosea sp. PAMC 26642]|nr:hypothetical protein AXW83_21230 [Bosea sp. PAMC 26642]